MNFLIALVLLFLTYIYLADGTDSSSGHFAGNFFKKGASYLGFFLIVAGFFLVVYKIPDALKWIIYFFSAFFVIVTGLKLSEDFWRKRENNRLAVKITDFLNYINDFSFISQPRSFAVLLFIFAVLNFIIHFSFISLN